MANTTNSQDISNAPLDIRSPLIAQTLGNVNNLCIWELLRRIGRAATTTYIAVMAKQPKEQVQASLDSLLAIGLVTCALTEVGQKLAGWKVTRQTIVVTYRTGEIEDETLRENMSIQLDEYRRTEIKRHIRPVPQRTKYDLSWNGLHSGTFTKMEIRELWHLLRQTEQFFNRCNERFKNIKIGQSQTSEYFVSLAVEPLLSGVLPIPLMQIVAVNIFETIKTPPTNGHTIPLSQREHEVAKLLANGSSNPMVAVTLGLSKHTVTELTRRLYRKLGIKKRAELVMKMEGLSKNSGEQSANS
jgi:DNA-binding CsgD family transcriptional regulator